MKTERMTLLVTPEEKARISAESARLGISASEYIRKLVSLLDAEDVAAAEELALLAPALTQMADRLETTFADFRREQAERDARWAHMATPEYREEIRRKVRADPSIDWPAMHRLFGGHTEEIRVAAE